MVPAITNKLFNTRDMTNLILNSIIYSFLGIAILVVAFLAMMALRLARSNGIRWFAFLGALGWVFFIAKLAVYKQASLFG